MNCLTLQQSRNVLALLIATLFLIGCSSDDDDDDDYVAQIENLTVINAIPNAPVLTVTLGVTDGADGDIDDITAILDFQAASSVDVDILDVTMTVTYEDPETDTTQTLLADVAIPMAVDSVHTVILSGSLQAPDYQLLTRAEGDLADSDEEAEFQLVNLTLLDPVTFSLLGESDGSSIARTVSSGLTSDVFRVSADQAYDVTVSDVETTRVEAGTLAFSPTNRFTLLLVEQPGKQNPSLFLAQGSAITGFKNLLEPARLRVANTVIDRDQLGYTISDSFTEAVQEVFTLAFADTGDYFTVDLDAVFLDVSHSDGISSFTNIVSLDEDSVYSAIVAGTAANSTVRLIEEDSRLIATQTNITLVNAANIVVNAGSDDEDTLHLDFYLLQAGESLEDVTPQAQGLDFLDAETVRLPAQPTVMVATESGTDNIVAGPTPIQLEEQTGILLTVVEAAGGGLPLAFSVGN